MAAAAPASQPETAGPRTLRVYVGTYTAKDSKGIYLFDMDLRTGSLEPRGLAAETVNPSFLAIHPNRRHLYAVGEIGDFRGRKAGAVSAFSIDAGSGRLSLLNQQPSGGAGPCHVAVHPAGRDVLVANYSSGSAAVLPIESDGRLGEARSVVQHEGSGPVAKRQAGPHAHSVTLDPAGKHAYVADLGVDKVFIYRLGPDGLAPADPPAAVLAPGSGPRHFAFHPSGRYACVINEIASTLTAFAYDRESGALRELQTLSTLPPGFDAQNTTADVHVHPSGRFVYGSNRGHDSIAIFRVDADSGRLTAVGHEPTQGRTPRNFGIDPTGTFLIAANQASDTLVVFRIDPATGALQPTGVTAPVSSPVCVQFMEPLAR